MCSLCGCIFLMILISDVFVFFFRQKTAYDMRIRGWSSDVCSSDLTIDFIMGVINWKEAAPADQAEELQLSVEQALRSAAPLTAPVPVWADGPDSEHLDDDVAVDAAPGFAALRSEEHTSELQSLMRTSYAVFCLKQKQHTTRR